MCKRFKVGDRVLYDHYEYTIEKDYGNGVYFIGNKDAFVDCVPACCLTLTENMIQY